MIKIKFILGTTKLIYVKKATYFPRTRKVLNEYPIEKNGKWDVGHGGGGKKERERERRQSGQVIRKKKTKW